MKLIKVSDSGTEYISRNRFNKGEKGLQMLVSKNLKTIFNTNLVGNETWINFGKKSIRHPHFKKIDGRIDTLGVTDKGVPVIIEYKERKGKNILNQVLSYASWMLYKQDSVEKYFNFQAKKGLFDPYIAPNFDYKPKIIMIAEDYNIHDLTAASMIRDDVELSYKKYELFTNENQKFLHIFDAAQLKWVMRSVKHSRGNKSNHPIHNIGDLNGFFIENNGTISTASTSSLDKLPICIDDIIEKEAKSLFDISTLTKNKKTKHGYIQGIGVENNGRASLILHSDDTDNLIDYALTQADWLSKKVEQVNGKSINWNRKDHRLILVCDSNLTEREKDAIDTLEYHKKGVMNQFIFEPRWLTHQSVNNEHYLIVGRTFLHRMMHTYPGTGNVYSMDSYTGEFRDRKLVRVFSTLRKEITNLGKEIHEGFYNKHGITYSSPNKFVIIEPRKEFISVKVSDSNSLNNISLPPHMRVDATNRFRIYNTKDISEGMKVIRKSYEINYC